MRRVQDLAFVATCTLLSIVLYCQALPTQPAAPTPCSYDPTFFAADCPNSSCWGAPPNGCGSRSLVVIHEQIVPDQWPAGVDFSAACNVHDICYFTPGTTKQACDQQFHEALLQECSASLACTSLPIIGEQCFGNPEQNPLWDACQGLADLYFNAVQQVGRESFDRDQAEAAAHAQRCRAGAAQRQPAGK